MAGLRFGVRTLFDGENLRSSILLDDDGTHGLGCLVKRAPDW
jgi:hypothetical protein